MSNGHEDHSDIKDNVDKYYWTPAGDVLLDDFLKRSRPSMIEFKGPGTDWVWVAGPNREKEEQDQIKALEEAKVIFETLQTKLKEIKSDPVKYPTRAKKGGQSAKGARDEAAEIAIKAIEETAKKHKYTTGKWLLFVDTERVDPQFATIARSVAEGPLCKDETVKLCKVATSDGSGKNHVMCLYQDNIWDQDANKRVLKILAGDHGLIPSSAKPDLYTILGITTENAPGMKTSIGTPDVWMKDEGGKETLIALLDEFKKTKKESQAEQKANREIEADSEEERQEAAKTGQKRMAASSTEAKTTKKARPAVKKTVKEIATANDIFGGGSDSESD